MFDLEQSIADWRRQMLAAGIKTPVPLEELEIHLRDDIKQQTGAGLSESNAFEISVQQIGRADALKVEFNKVEGAKEKSHRALARFALGYGLLTYCSIKLMGIQAFLKCEISPAWRLAGWADIVLFAFFVLSILCWRWAKRAFPVIPDKRRRTGIGIFFGFLGVAGLVVLRRVILPNSEFTGGQGLVLVLWFFTLMIALAVVLAGLEDAARPKRTS